MDNVHIKNDYLFFEMWRNALADDEGKSPRLQEAAKKKSNTTVTRPKKLENTHEDFQVVHVCRISTKVMQCFKDP
ncbi:hypothetical protein C5167_003784 [Papaver somniferum]|uniref:Uncharacterized protein n=1 Tax=Papaver somniferum TaxID=3469 RepID=A0A4Y7L3P4_PAPSO|nr:hypothetical protein C5167_003784 [Papaver somniferum]